MRTIEIARRLAELNQKEDAQQAYLIALQEAEGKNPEEEMESASYLFFSEGNYRAAFTAFVSLYNRGFFQAELMDLLTQAFYLPNVNDQKKQYANNCMALSRYPYLFQHKFPNFEDLTIQFFPFDDNGYIPFYKEENRFGEYVNFNHPVIDRYFFKDLENPVLAADVFSQYQLEYLNDTVRKSEWVGRENHIYLHYTNWLTFCTYLQCLNFRKLLKEEKFVFLVENEISQYPIDFKERFQIDYSKYPLKPVQIREVNKLIWHTQLSTHNGGDFFNEILFGHPNLLAIDSIMFDNICDTIQEIKKGLQRMDYQKPMIRALAQVSHVTDKDCLVALFLLNAKIPQQNDPNSRIAPALLFQPHFPNMLYDVDIVNEKKGWTTLYSKAYESIQKSPIFQGFKYIKTFTPIRRITTSYAASVRFMVENSIDDNKQNTEKKEENTLSALPDLINIRMLNRSFMIDWQDRLFQDSILVRFEDGKLNPKATFTALAEFLDIPYTESMTYCSGVQGLNPESMKGNVLGFDPATVYRTYDEYANNEERAYLEFFFRDVYEAYGYDFQYYNGEDVNQEWVKNKIQNFTCANHHIRESWRHSLQINKAILHKVSNENDTNEKFQILRLAKDTEEQNNKYQENFNESIEQMLDNLIQRMDKDRYRFACCLLEGLNFINRRGQPLHMMKALKLDPALLEQPLYH